PTRVNVASRCRSTPSRPSWTPGATSSGSVDRRRRRAPPVGVAGVDGGVRVRRAGLPDRVDAAVRAVAGPRGGGGAGGGGGVLRRAGGGRVHRRRARGAERAPRTVVRRLRAGRGAVERAADRHPPLVERLGAAPDRRATGAGVAVGGGLPGDLPPVPARH